jgi:DNA polymerase III alpha subunit
MNELVIYLQNLCKLKKENGICASAPAVEKLRERIRFVTENSPFIDKSLEINHMENDLFGISLSSQKIDAYNTSEVTYTCKDFINDGASNILMTFGVDILRVSEYTTQSGESQGKLRADLVVADSTGKIKVKVWSDVYENVISACVEHNSIILTGKKGYGRYADFCIATEIKQAI